MSKLIAESQVIARMHRKRSLFGDGDMASIAVYSHCERYRYSLVREWNSKRPGIAFIGLNPSTATERDDDPTVAKCVEWAEKWGHGSMWMLNAFAYRATDPLEMRAQREPKGKWNDAMLLSVLPQAATIVCCWGNHGHHRDRQSELLRLLKPYALHCLDVTKQNAPWHPLFLAKSTELKPWTP